MGLVIITLYPAVWGAVQPISRIAATLLIIGLLWTVVAALKAIQKWTLEMESTMDRHFCRIKKALVNELSAELDALDDADWADMMHRLTVDDPWKKES